MANKYTPDKGEDWYREQYVEKERSTTDIAEDVDVGPQGVLRRLKQYGIPRRNPAPEYPKLHDEEWVRSRYVDDHMTFGEIAEEAGGCSIATVQYWMEEHDIDPRTRAEYASRWPACFTHDMLGYERWSVKEGDEHNYVQVHRLTAVAEYGYDAVCGMVVHHKNQIQWDNRPENLELMTRSDHSRHHAEEMPRKAGDFK